MFVFNCTKSAAAFLSPRKSKDTETLIQPVPKFGIDEVGTSEVPTSQWLIQHTVQLDQDILYVCHIQHRFVMVFTEVEKGNCLSFMQYFGERIINHLCWLVDDMAFNLNTTPQDWIDNIRSVHNDKPIFCQRYSPSVGASITRFRVGFDMTLFEIGCLPDNEEAGAFEADENSRIQFSNSREGEFYPANELFCDCLENYMGVSQKDLPTFKSLSLDYFEKNFNFLLDIPSPYSSEVIEMVNSHFAEEKTKQKNRPDNVIEIKSKK